MAFLLFLAFAAAGQILDLKPSIQHASFDTSTSTATVAPGGTVSLWLDVAPKPKIHIYGPGAKGYLPIALSVVPPPTAAAGVPSYPKPQLVFFPALNERTPVYSTKFRVAQPLTISPQARPGEVLTIPGMVEYQACDDVLCYPPSKAAVNWTVRVS